MKLSAFLFLGALFCVQCLAKTHKYIESDEGFRNPMKGFRPTRFIEQSDFPPHEYATVYKHYIPYNCLESNSSDGVEKIINECNEMWTGIETKNIKVIPRLVLFYPGKGYYFPGDLSGIGTRNDWFREDLRDRLVAMIDKMGAAWDQDPRVAAVELGLWGKWGEHHIYEKNVPLPSRIPKSFWEPMGKAAVKAFPNKKVLVRYPETFSCFQNRLGMFWDSFALPDDLNWSEQMMTRNTWKKQMISGEVAYDWGDQVLLGGSPDGTLSSFANTNWVIEWIKKVHCSSLGWIDLYENSNQVIVENAKRIQKNLGYRFFIKQASIPDSVSLNGTLDFEFLIENRGNAPFYYEWPVEVALLNENRVPVVKYRLSNDIREWMPGHEFRISASIDIPCSMQIGIYTFTVSILDPAGMEPSLRFANENYYRGGLTPLAKVGVGISAYNQTLGEFDELKGDDTLFYSFK